MNEKPYEIAAMSDLDRINGRGEVEQLLWVKYYVGKLGPFTLTVTRGPNQTMEMQSALSAAAANVRTLQG